MRPVLTTLALCLVFASPAASAGTPPERELVAVVEFDATENLRAREPELGRSLAALAHAALDDTFRVVDRETVAKALADAKLEAPKLFDSADKTKVLGSVLGVKRVFVGLATTFGNKIVIHLKRLEMTGKHFDRSTTVTCVDLEELPELVPELVRRLLAPAAKAPGIAVRRSAKPLDRDELVKNLVSDDAGVRFSAAVELGRLGDRSAVRPLMSSLTGDKDTFVRRAAARSLGELRAREAVPVLIATLGDKEFFVAITAHKALTKITGQDFGFRENLTVAEIEEIAGKARDWWAEHELDPEDEK